MWLMLHRKLATTDRLTKWGLDVPKICVFCQSKEESIEHLFVQRPFSIYLWNKLLMWIQQHAFPFSDWAHSLQGSIQHGKGNSQQAQIFKKYFGQMCVWAVY